jgi:hypothetical protein
MDKHKNLLTAAIWRTRSREILMRFRGLFLTASLLACSQLAQSADVWQGQPSYPANSQYYYGQASRVLPGYPQAGNSEYRFNAYENLPAVSPGNYRFRDLNSGRTNQANQRTQVPAAKSQRSVSYWGGNPVHQGNTAAGTALRYDYPGQSVQSHQAYQPPGMAHASPQYRFRPMQKRVPVETRSRLKYRPMQVEIPQHVRFRPLNPVAQTRQRPAQSNRYQQMWQQPNHYVLQQPGFPTHAQPWPRDRYVYNYPHARGWYPNNNAWWAPAPQPMMPMPMAMPGYAWREPAPRFRPQPQSQSRQIYYPPVYRRYPQSPQPYWAQNRFAGYPVRPYPAPTIYNRYPARLPMARPQWQAPVDRYSGTDWYDGQRDGEGAWYKLANRNLPAVSQRWSDPAGDNLATE